MTELIPAIDILQGKCVRLTKGDYNTQKTYNDDPVAVAQEFQQHGIDKIHIVDLDGARSRHIVNHKTLERIAQATSLTIDFGGGIKTSEDLRIAFSSGAAMVTIGSVAATHPQLFTEWLSAYGAERIILGADTLHGMVAINGWQQQSPLTLSEYLKDYIGKGVRQVLCTDISKDGTMQGPATGLYADIMRQYPQCRLIASGGVSSMADVVQLDKAGIPAAVIGKAIYEGTITLTEIAQWAAGQSTINS